MMETLVAGLAALGTPLLGQEECPGGNSRSNSYITQIRLSNICFKTNEKDENNATCRESADPNSEAMDALRNFQLRNSKMYKSATKSATESLGTALKMIKKRRSLFEHGR